MKKYIFLFTLFTLFFAKAQLTFEKTFSLDFPHPSPNYVGYIQLPSTTYSGILKITIVGTFNHQLNVGAISKTIAIINSPNYKYFYQTSQVDEAFGPIATQWAIGDCDQNTMKIPIYHLVGSGNQLSVKVEGQSPFERELVPMRDGITVQQPVAFNGSIPQRPYKSMMQDRLGINVQNPNYTLDVNGTVHAKEVKVDMEGWADYVFQEDYQLPTLEEVERHINEKGYLPHIPSTKEVTENGLSIGESQKLLLQKIEELTLYTIEQNKLNKEQSLLLQKQRQEIQDLRNEVRRIRKK